MPYTTFHEEQITDDDTEPIVLEKLQNAADLASDQGQGTFFTDQRGKRLFAVSPVDFAEHALTLEVT
jgi:hypothetical protein